MNHRTSRRSIIKSTAAALTSTSGLLAACAPSPPASAKRDAVLRIGYVYPFSGDASAFGGADPFLLRTVRTAFENGLTSGGRKYNVEILDRDGRTDPKFAAETAAELVHRHRIDLMLCCSTPEMVNPVADVCEKAGIPCLSTAVPWEAWYFGRGATVAKPFKYTYHFFFGASESGAACDSLCHDGKVKTNDVIGVLWPDDSDGQAARKTLGPLLKKAGFTIADPGAFPDGTRDFSAQIKQFQREDAEIFSGFALPGDFSAFWRQASLTNFRPKIAMVAKTCHIPSQLEPLGASGFGISSGFWWTPQFPYPSSLTGQTGKQLARDYQRQTGRQWTQMLGGNMALFEVAAHVLKNVSDPKDRQALAAEIGGTKLTTMVGRLDWTSGPVENVSTQPLVMAQWKRAPLTSGFLYEPVIVDNGSYRDIPLGGPLEPLI